MSHRTLGEGVGVALVLVGVLVTVGLSPNLNDWTKVANQQRGWSPNYEGRRPGWSPPKVP